MVRTKPEPGPYNVILISFDTMRRDVLHCYGCRKRTTPNLDRLAAEGALFEDTVVNCGWTLPQHITMLTGVHPLRHKVYYIKKRCRLSPRFRTLAEIFSDNGYLTFGFGNTNGYGGGWKYGFYRGMRHYTTVFPYNNMMEQVVAPVTWAMRMAGVNPFFMYIHTNDTHEPFAASEPFGSKWGGSYRNRYEGEITYVDHYFGEILKALEKLGLKNRTLVVATSDHGSEFQEHGFLEKKVNLYEEIVQVPLIMRLPGVLPRRKRISGLCETMDIAPTILDVCGLPVHEQMDGRSLLGRIRDKRNRKTASVVAHTLHETVFFYEHFSIRTERWKYIRCEPFYKDPKQLRSRWGGDAERRFERLRSVAEVRNGIHEELYDLKRDPGETTNLIGRRPALARTMRKEINKRIRSFDPEKK